MPLARLMLGMSWQVVPPPPENIAKFDDKAQVPRGHTPISLFDFSLTRLERDMRSLLGQKYARSPLRRKERALVEHQPLCHDGGCTRELTGSPRRPVKRRGGHTVRSGQTRAPAGRREAGVNPSARSSRRPNVAEEPRRTRPAGTPTLACAVAVC
jgi:hypothetical protein